MYIYNLFYVSYVYVFKICNFTYPRVFYNITIISKVNSVLFVFHIKFYCIHSIVYDNNRNYNNNNYNIIIAYMNLMAYITVILYTYFEWILDFLLIPLFTRLILIYVTLEWYSYQSSCFFFPILQQPKLDSYCCANFLIYNTYEK